MADREALTRGSYPKGSRVFRQVVCIEIIWGYDPEQVEEEHRERGPYVDWEALIRETVLEGGPGLYGTFSVPSTGTASEVEELTDG